MIHRLFGVPSRRRRWLLLVAGLAVAVSTVVLLVSIDRQFIDLQVYRFSVAVFWSGGDLYGTRAPTSAGVDLPFIYPPFAAVVLTPLTMLPWPAAAGTAVAVSIVSLALAIHMVTRRLWPAGGRWRAVSVTAVVLPAAMLLEPVRSTLHFGQINLWLMALVLLDCLGRRQALPRGVLVGVAAAIKLTPAAFVLFFLVTGDRRAVRNAVVTMTVAAGVTWLVAPGASARYWFGEVAGASGMSASVFASNQAIVAALGRLGSTPTTRALLGGLLIIGVVWAAAVIMHRVGRPEAVAVNAGAALLLSPISWTHHWVWVVPALLVGAAGAWRIRPARSRAAAGMALVGAAAVFTVGLPMLMPSDSGRELSWTPWQHVLGNSYLLLATAALAGGLWWVVRRSYRAPLPGGTP